MVKFSDRVRFNWGFWDAVADVKNGRSVRNMAGHFDAAYAAGYKAGIANDDPNIKTSDAAWSASRVAA